MEYPLCDQVVTVYRRRADTVLRQVLEGCYLDVQVTAVPGDDRQQRKFLLVVPGSVQRVFPGDRLVPGEGPQVTAGDWDRFLPVFQEDMLIVGTVKRFYWNGELCHVEAM